MGASGGGRWALGSCPRPGTPPGVGVRFWFASRGTCKPPPQAGWGGAAPSPERGGGLPLVLHGRCLLSRFSPLPSSLPLFSSFRFHLRSAFALFSGSFSSFSSPAVGVFVSFFEGILALALYRFACSGRLLSHSDQRVSAGRALLGKRRDRWFLSL